MSQDYFCRCHERPTPGPGWCRCQEKCPALWAIHMIEPTTLSHFLSHGLSPNLECRPYFDEYRDDPWNLLTVAIFHRRDDMMRILLEAGADFRTPKDWPYQFSTPLHLAIQLPKYEPFTRVSFLKVVEVLLEHGILYGTVGQDVNARVGWDEEQTAMMRLASTPQEDGAAIADLLLAHGAYVEEVSDHERPLTLAIAAPFPEMVEWLVTNGADANYSDAIDFRPLNFAVGVLASDCSELLKLQVLQIIQFLLDYDADGNTPLNYLLNVCCEEYGKDKLFEEMIEVLVNAGTLFTPPEDPRNWVLHVAFDLKITRGFQYIDTLIRLATPDVLNWSSGGDIWSGENDHDFPLLHLAAQHGDVEVVRCLLRNGADVNRTDHMRFTAMHWATYRHRIGVLVALRDKVDWNLPCNMFGVKYGYTPLHMVFWENPGLEKCTKPNYQECVHIIAGIHGANLNVVSVDESSPLTLALGRMNPSAPSTPEDMLKFIDVAEAAKMMMHLGADRTLGYSPPSESTRLAILDQKTWMQWKSLRKEWQMRANEKRMQKTHI